METLATLTPDRLRSLIRGELSALKQRGLLRPANMAVAVHSLPHGTAESACSAVMGREPHSQVSCPPDHTGAHQQAAMAPFELVRVIGGRAERPAVDGLSPAVIMVIKAHGVAMHRRSNRDTLALGRTVSGDTRSYGAILVEIRVPGRHGRLIRFIVSVSGAKPWRDHRLAENIASAIVDDLFSEGDLEVTLVPGPFIVGADPEAVALFAAV